MYSASCRDGIQHLTRPLMFLVICHAAHALSTQIKRETNALVCGPASAWDVIKFFALNYVAHAFTVKSVPGTTARKSIQLAVLALVLPYSGVVRACDAIACVRFGDNELRHAQRAGALCMVKRLQSVATGASTFGPQNKNCTIQGEISGDLGRHGFGLMLVPQDLPLAPVGGGDVERSEQETGRREPAEENAATADISTFHLLSKPKAKATDKIHIASSNTALKSIIAIGQLVYAAYTLYNVDGRQIDRWGYASFGLTVIPYAIMSLLNLLAAVLSPDFPALSLVRNDDMAAAERKGIRFAGVVATVALGRGSTGSKSRQNGAALSRYFWRELPTRIVAVLALVAPYVVIGVLTHFRPEQTKWNERYPVMAWLVGGQVFGWCYSYFFRPQTYLQDANARLPLHKTYLGTWLVIAVAGVTAASGMFIVGRQIIEFGNCVEAPAHMVNGF